MSARTVTVDDACAHIAELLRAVSAGQEIVITEGARAVARVVPAGPARKPRRPGLNQGAIQTSADFDAPLPDEFWSGQK